MKIANKQYEYIVSACLAGHFCKYDGGSNPCDFVQKLVAKNVALPICPETLSGLPCPREPSEKRNGRYYSKSGKDLTDYFEKGGTLAMDAAIKSGACKAILKSRSPSCGYGKIYDGSFTGALCEGNGAWAEKLLKNGFEIFSEENLPEIQNME